VTAAEKNVIERLPWDFIRAAARQADLDPIDVAAFIMKESRGDRFAVRFEPGWKYAKDVIKHAKANMISQATEKNCQMTSWGHLQIMGTVAREVGYVGPLSALVETDINLVYGCKKLRKVFDRYADRDSAIAAFNCGTPKRTKLGKFVNQDYVDRWHEHRKNIVAVMGSK
jgi:soluble lytic murein transglycosylase-like protein